MVHALAAAVGSVLLWARAPPSLEAVLVDQLGGAAAGARLHEQAVTAEAHPAPLLLLPRLHLEVSGLEGEGLVLAFDLDAKAALGNVELGDDATPTVEIRPRVE